MTNKIYIGPMTKNIVDATIDFVNSNNIIGAFIPSRRQIEYSGGYVNNWNTENFSNYVKSKTKNLILQRDHAGPGQGSLDDDGFVSLSYDCKHFDIIHMDPWKKYPEFLDGLNETIKMVQYCYNLNPKIQYEVGTEESIRRFEADELNELIQELKNRLKPEIYKNIKYLVIQSGTSLKGNNQTGKYNSDRLLEMVSVCKKHNLLSKEHNGDYISTRIIKDKFNLGLDAINIAPEFGLIETQTYLDNIKDAALFNKFWKICYESKKWVKWVSKDFDPNENKLELIKISGHYVISNPEFISSVKSNIPNIDSLVKKNVYNKLYHLYS